MFYVSFVVCGIVNSLSENIKEFIKFGHFSYVHINTAIEDLCSLNVVHVSVIINVSVLEQDVFIR